jgi:hypothetical protein
VSRKRIVERVLNAIALWSFLFLRGFRFVLVDVFRGVAARVDLRSVPAYVGEASRFALENRAKLAASLTHALQRRRTGTGFPFNSWEESLGTPPGR